MKFAYADPPYPGQALKHYGNDPRASEVDHVALVAQLEQYDAWALSTSEPALEYVIECLQANGLRRAAGDYRVCPWVKPFASFKPGVNPAWCWEPVIVRGGRQLGRDVPTVRDWVSANITMRRGMHGAKPDKFCYWLFDFVGLMPDDKFTDLYLGSGAVTRAWEQWCRQYRFPAECTAAVQMRGL